MKKPKSDHFFLFDHLNKNIKTRSIHGGAVTLASQGILFLIRTISMMVLARLLVPHDFGLVAMVTSVTGFVQILGDFGLSTVTIQREHICHDQVSTIFWINIAISIISMIIISALSPAVAWFYESPELTLVMIAFSLICLFGGLANQHQALLIRKMRFRAIAIAQIISAFIGALAAIYAAINGLGYWALVLNYIASSATLSLGIWLASGWYPSLPLLGVKLQSMLKFGFDITCFNIINYFSRNLDNILIGRFCGACSLGFYSTAYNLLMLPINNLRNPLNSVALPSLSKFQNDAPRYRSYYRKYISILAFISMPLIVFMFVYSENIIILLLGKNWLGASRIFKILAIAALIQPIASSRGLILLSLGKGERYLLWGVFNSIVVVGSIIIGIFWGVIGVAFAYTFGNYFILYPSLRFVFKDTPLRISDFFSSIMKPLATSLMMGIVGSLLQLYLVKNPNIVVLSICFIACLISYFICWTIIPGGIKSLREFYLYGTLLFIKNEK